MNDHEAMEEINAILEQLFAGEIDQSRAVNRIAIITGRNAIEHAKAKGEQS